MKLQSCVTTTVTFIGDDPTQIMREHKDVIAKIWEYCGGIQDGFARIHVSPRDRETSNIEWTMIISSPFGRQTFLVKQHRHGGEIYIKDGN